MRSPAAVMVALLLCATSSGAYAPASPLTPQDRKQPGQRIVGSWIGTLQIGPSQLRIVFNIEADSAGALSATLDSPDQGAKGIPVSGVVLNGDSLMLGVLAVGGGYAGRLEAGDTTVTGTWRQGGMSLPLVVRRTPKPPALARPPCALRRSSG